MADEVKEVVKDAVVESTSTATADSSATTPVAEKATAKTEAAVPYDRFQEVIKAKNSEKQLREQYEARIKELETRLPTQAGPDKLVARLMAGGMKEDAAKLIAETTREANREAMAPIHQREKAQAVDGWVKDIERNDPDYKKLKPMLEKAFDELPDEEKQSIVSSPKGLERFYKSVKADVLELRVKEAHADGVKQGYEGKVSKEGMGSGPKSGTAQATVLTFESIRAGAVKGMSDAEYLKRLPEINAIVAKGPSA